MSRRGLDRDDGYLRQLPPVVYTFADFVRQHADYEGSDIGFRSAAKLSAWAQEVGDFPETDSRDIQVFRDWARSKALGDGKEALVRKAFQGFVLERQRLVREARR